MATSLTRYTKRIAKNEKRQCMISCVRLLILASLSKRRRYSVQYVPLARIRSPRNQRIAIAAKPTTVNAAASTVAASPNPRRSNIYGAKSEKKAAAQLRVSRVVDKTEAEYLAYVSIKKSETQLA